MKKKISILLILLLSLMTIAGCSTKSQSNTQKHKINIVTSTNIYANIAKQIVGKYGKVQAVISNGNTDPHDFEASFKSAKEVAEANIVIANGLGYDSWMENLAKSNNEHIVKVGEELLHKKMGANPHIWYDLEMPKAYVKYILKRANKIAPSHKRYFERNARKYLTKIDQIESLAKKINGKNSKPVFVSEPVFDYALQYCHFTIEDKEFEEAVENETDPNAKTVHLMQEKINKKKIAFFVNNTQASSSTVKTFVGLCRKRNIPVLNVRETMPNGTSYIAWMKENYEKLAEVAK